jgi:hypothetical protein
MTSVHGLTLKALIVRDRACSGHPAKSVLFSVLGVIAQQRIFGLTKTLAVARALIATDACLRRARQLLGLLVGRRAQTKDSDPKEAP